MTRSEINRNNARQRTYALSCTCGECGKCRQREYRRKRRQAGNDKPLTLSAENEILKARLRELGEMG